VGAIRTGTLRCSIAFSVNALLKSTIAALASVVVIMLALAAWDSWTRLSAVNRIAASVDASTHLFTALHNLRVDRAQTNRNLLADEPLTSMQPVLRAAREGDLPALRAALPALAGVPLADREAVIADLTKRVEKLAAMHQETAAAFAQPKASRRAGLADEFMREANSLQEVLDKLSVRLARAVKLEDAYVDQLMGLKQFAWTLRNAAGDASLMVSNGLGGIKMPADAQQRYTASLARADAMWESIEQTAATLQLPAAFTSAMEQVKREYYARDFTELRGNLLKTVLAGEKPSMASAQWTPLTVGKLATLLGVADAALAAARDHTAEQRAAALSRLTLQLGLLALAVAFAAGLMLMVSRHVTGPLRRIQEAMLRLAGGDLTAEVSFAQRKDEIGALAGAMQTFKTSMVEADRLRTEQKEVEARASATRRSEMQRLANEFQAAVGSIVDAVSNASSELEAAAGTLTKTAETTQQLSGTVASASEIASANVQSVASAAEEMTGSVNEIARQVQESSRIAGEAVKQAEKTDSRITELSSAASRIGDVVKLITAIAEQTNLLALNATIEAARAGEAGKGFAVVASEVKQLATQTAKATDEIGSQIATMQTATQDSVNAIKEISGTIGRIAEIANAIAAAVEEQGAATAEISRNVQQASHGTAQVAGNIADVNRGASETGTASSQVLGSAQSLARESGHLKTEVERFVAMVRAA
jgi:methyl-accepting chemotaxis protein